MKGWLQGQFRQAYERLLLHEITDGPKHIAVIQDGNRR
ncbi:MAG: UDP pyrophosphate synthase, partial [Halobacteriaceae archaeon]